MSRVEPPLGKGRLVVLRPRGEIIYVSQGRTVLATGTDGFLNNGPERGLFVHETRLLSRYRYLIDGKPPYPAAVSNVEQHSWLGYYICSPPGLPRSEKDSGSGAVSNISQQTLELRVSRYAGEGMHEDLDLTNYTQWSTEFEFEIELDADFADQLETLQGRQQWGTIEKKWSDGELQFDYFASHRYNHQEESGKNSLHRALIVRVFNNDSEPAFHRSRLVFPVRLNPGEKWHTCIDFIPVMDGVPLQLHYRCRSFFGTENDFDRKRSFFLNNSTVLKTEESATLAGIVVAAYEQARNDLAALRLFDLDEDDQKWIMAAGLPMYVALFGRDTLTASWQAAMLGPEMMQGALHQLAKLQGKERNDWRDEDPGRMLHEAHDGPLEYLNYNPRKRYYGSVTTSGFFPVIVSQLWHWTGKKELVQPLIEPSIRALQWLDSRACDLDGDGFYEYKTRSEQGVRHQAWKDSSDAVVDKQGRQVEPPIATCEEQAFVYLAKLHLSELLWWLDRKEEAKKLYDQAAELKKRFNEAFWMEEERFIAMGLDSQKRQIGSISSNPGHCLAAGIIEESCVMDVTDRMMSAELFSGWGIRTLSSANPAYNPYSYHRGSVWPVEQATFALGFSRYGLHDHLEKLARAFFESAALFANYRLPELFSGHPRDSDHPFPALYPQANSPQAWSASAVFLVLQTLLGLYPYAPLHLLLIDPHLPDWLPDITLLNLRVGKGVCDLRFYRKKNGESEYAILRKEGSLHIVRQPSPWSLTAGYAERIRDLLNSLL